MERQRYGWRLAALMGEHKIRTGVQLRDLLAAQGYVITSSQLSRIIYDRPTQVKTDLLDALGGVFNCTINDLMPLLDNSQPSAQPGSQPGLQSQPAARPKHVRDRQPGDTLTEEDIGGPVVHPFPLRPIH